MVASSRDVGTALALSLFRPLANLRVAASRLERRRMTTQTLTKRVDTLEERVTRLEELPAHVDALALQISQLRDEMRMEFSAVGGGIRAGDEETRRTLQEEIRAGDEETRRTLQEEIRAGDEETRRVLGDEIRAGDTLVMDHARALHEDVVSRLALIQEGGPHRRKRSGTKGNPQ
jgi:hypothetical protein